MDGDGSIQVNHTHHKYMNCRLTIKLKNTPANRQMLDLMAKVIGGKSRPDSPEAYRWVCDHRKNCEDIIQTYDPLHPRMRSKLAFFREALHHRDIHWFFANRHLMGERDPHRGPLHPGPEWISGFVEAEGSFVVRSNGNLSFAIGQKEAPLLHGVRDFFQVDSKVRQRRDGLHYLEVYNRKTLGKILDHLERYPLLGEKAVSLRKFKSQFSQVSCRHTTVAIGR